MKQDQDLCTRYVCLSQSPRARWFMIVVYMDSCCVRWFVPIEVESPSSREPSLLFVCKSIRAGCTLDYHDRLLVLNLLVCPANNLHLLVCPAAQLICLLPAELLTIFGTNNLNISISKQSSNHHGSLHSPCRHLGIKCWSKGL